MKKNKIWYLDERAEQLAIVYLTRRDDLKITRQQSSDYGLDILVSIVKDGEYTGRVFGVQVKAKKSTQQIRPVRSQTDMVRIDINNLAIPQDIPFPLCLFVFTMDTDEGYYRWIKKPVHNGEQESLLLFQDDNIFKKLGNKQIDEIVTEVNNWYESKLKVFA